MFVFMVGSFLIGMLLAHFFRVYSLFPVSVLAILFILLNPFDAHWTWRGLIIESAALVAMLQVGFLAGGVLQVYLPKSLRRVPAKRRTADLVVLRPHPKL